ncbi:MAG: hypothetical protein WC740_06030 [Verrucomicrobiia bacterium]
MKTISRNLLLLAMAALVLGVAVAWPRIDFFMLTGRFSPIEKIETLQNPVAVTRRSSDVPWAGALRLGCSEGNSYV